MIPGRENLELINQSIHQARTEHESAVARLGELRRELDALHTEAGECYRRLAGIRLDGIQAGQLVSRLDESDRAILELLEKLKQTRSDLQKQVDAGAPRRAQLEEQRKELERRRDEAGEKIRRRLEEARKSLMETDEYRRGAERAREAAEVAARADEKATRTEQDRIEKGKPYEADSLFMYLWKRRYLTPDYRGGRLTRQLDGWVANLIDYPRNRVNYHMLQELPDRLREHAVKAKQTAQAEAQALEAMEEKAEESDDVAPLETALRDAENQLKQHDAEMEADVTGNRRLLQELAAINTANDPVSRRVVEMQTAALKQAGLDELLQEARKTPRQEDDAIVARLRQIEQRQNQISAEIQSVDGFLQQRRRNLDELEDLRRRYRDNGYDSQDSSFPGGFALGALLGQLLQGIINSDMVWKEVGRHYQGGPRRRGRGGFGGGPGGPPEERGGFGGGGFRTGGGF